MTRDPLSPDPCAALALAADHAQAFRQGTRSLTPAVTARALRDRFCVPLPDTGLPGDRVIADLIAAAEPGLVGNTDPNFFAWVMGGSDPLGVAADWLTSAWGQNAGIYQASPAAAIAEEAVEAWLLDLLDLPRDASVGFVSGATTAAFVGLAAARAAVLARAGHDVEREGLQGAPFVRIFLSDDVHVTNIVALRHLGFGEANLCRLPSDAAGLMRADDLARALAGASGPKIVVAQAGHINSGGFEALDDIARIARAHGAWMHVDGAFGLWARALDRKKHLASGAELADSWSVDGHKWLQIPYGSGFAIVRDREAHRRAMRKAAGYLNEAPGDGRNPSDFVPGLSRRAHGFAAWAVLRGLGRSGVAALLDRHCRAAARLAKRIRGIDGLEVLNRVDLNQIVVGACDRESGRRAIPALADALNARHGVFVRPAVWKERTVLRLSVISRDTGEAHVTRLAQAMQTAWRDVQAASGLEVAAARPRPAATA